MVGELSEGTTEFRAMHAWIARCAVGCCEQAMEVYEAFMAAKGILERL